MVYRCDSPVVNCSENAHCIDEVEGFQCVCNEGYTGNGVNCCKLCHWSLTHKFNADINI